ncbi:retrovirus-related Pol polyprotein from transposon 17.6 [Trichonephila clavata]|uniref:Retrovirus-related Pol polyprotein from transposon 17.6 n=1 Tax=Trichonephila clavata TaxID=2740835 RepID=A0A8X6FBS0_TRICU|nr:retrovirus-related Pol polyprotein from transposon 17.6 [Trichonephila clavata]
MLIRRCPDLPKAVILENSIFAYHSSSGEHFFHGRIHTNFSEEKRKIWTTLGVESRASSDDSQIARIVVKLPPIWTNNIKLWFVQAESNFALSAITNDQTKYNNIIAAIDQETLSSVSDILFKLPATNKYNELKERLIAEFSDSANKQIRKLLSELQLGDDKPSYLLRKMRELASGASLNDDFLKNLMGLQRLPSEMQSILSVSSETLENLAKLADEIAEVRTDPFLNVFVMDKSPSSNPALPTNPRRFA